MSISNQALDDGGDEAFVLSKPEFLTQVAGGMGSGINADPPPACVPLTWCTYTTYCGNGSVTYYYLYCLESPVKRLGQFDKLVTQTKQPKSIPYAITQDARRELDPYAMHQPCRANHLHLHPKIDGCLGCLACADMLYIG